MPTYVYKCATCEHRFEAVQGFHDEPLNTCPDCGGTVRRVIGNVGVTFKGSGFYRTDSRATQKPSKKSPASGTSAKTESGKPSSASTGGSTDTTTASKDTTTPKTSTSKPTT